MNFTHWLRKPEIKLSQTEQLALKQLCESVAGHIRNAGYKTKAFSDRSPALPKNIHERIFWLQNYNELLAHQSPAALGDHKDLLWKFFGKTRYTPTSDIFDRITNEDYIEIYDTEGYQLYRSLNYFKIVSFSVEDLVTMNWKSDFKRNSKVSLSLIELNLRFATGFFTKTFDCATIPVHNVRELMAKGHLIELQLKYISPLKKNGKCVAIMAVSDARRLESGNSK